LLTRPGQSPQLAGLSGRCKLTTQQTIRHQVEEVPDESGPRADIEDQLRAGIQKGASRERIDSTPD